MRIHDSGFGSASDRLLCGFLTVTFGPPELKVTGSTRVGHNGININCWRHFQDLLVVRPNPLR